MFIPRIDHIWRECGGKFQLTRNSICLAFVGSTSHNTHTPKTDPNSIDDIDITGIVCPPMPYVVGLSEWEGWNKQYDELDLVFYSVRKIFRLLMKSNPNVLCLLNLPEHCYIQRTLPFLKMMEKKEIFFSKEVYPSFIGYAHGQMKKMTANACQGYMGIKRKELVEKYSYDCKNASHCIRLLRMGIEFLQTGNLKVWRDDDAEELRAIKRGEWSLDKVQNEAHTLFDKAKDAVAKSPLKDKPNQEEAEKLLVDILRREWEL